MNDHRPGRAGLHEMLPWSSAWILAITSTTLIALSVAGIVTDPLSLLMQLPILLIEVLLLSLSVVRLAFRQHS